MRTALFCLLAVLLVAGVATADKGDLHPVQTRGVLDCAGAIPIDCGDVVSGDNTGLVNTVTYYSCSTWNESAGEVIYELVLDEPDVCYEVTGALSDMSADLDIFFLKSCDEDSCLAYGSVSFTSDCLKEGTYYIVVDGYNGAESAFTLTVTCVECVCPVDPGDCPEEQNYLPFLEDFERGDCFPPAGWTIVNGGDFTDGETWSWSDVAGDVCNNLGTAACYYGAYGEFQDEWLITPIIYTGSATDIEISFQHAANIWTYCTDPNEVLVSTTDTDIASFTSVWSYGCEQPEPNCETILIELGDPYLPTDHIYVAWRMVGLWAEDYFVDNIVIEEASTAVEETSWGAIKALYR